MKFYVDFKDLDAEDMPSNISNTYKLQVRSCNAGSDIRVELKSLADHDKQVRKEVIEEIRNKIEQAKLIYEWKGEEITIEDILDKIGEKEC